MTKNDMLKELQSELDKAKMYRLDGINSNCSNGEIQNALDCMRCSDEVMNDYLTVVKLKYPNIYRTVTQSEYLKHTYNRLFVYNTARQIIAE